MIQVDYLVFDMLAEPSGSGKLCKMDDAASSIRQYVAALSRLLLEFGVGEIGRCDGCRVDMDPI
jgi:hypothetical protein